MIIKDLPKSLRSDLYLGMVFPEITRSVAKKVIMNGFVTINGSKTKPHELIHNGDEITIDTMGIRTLIANLGLSELHPVEMNLDIVYEDLNTIAINKPAGMVVHPVYQHTNDTLMNGLTYYAIHNNQDPFIRIRPVNRLDRDTSGIVLCSKTLEAHQDYSRQFKRREVRKIYLAIVKGEFPHDAITVENELIKNNRIYQSGLGGEHAVTDIKLLQKNEQYSLLRVMPHTGRTHQIRVHLSELGFPIVGDNLYGGIEFIRLLLHSWQLEIKLYPNHTKVNLQSKIPAEFTDLFTIDVGD